ncbi:MAG: cell division protein ZapA [Paludibacteraceae bacterium]|jgi:cell division protein ZapA (FtsZ GTPase activity inhibitor)|nr:cell division protein ZapA [Paludibacteraceae bacterium]
MAEERIITVRINGFTTKLSIPAEREEIYRKAAKILNERIAVYNQKYSLPYQDILSMVAYEMAVEAMSLESQYHSTPLSEMAKLSELLSQELDVE